MNAIVKSPFQSATDLAPAQQHSAGTEIASGRDIAEVQAAMAIAKRFPRDPAHAMDRVLNSCTRPTLAEGALYSYSRGGQDVTGPSIRLAEAIAQQWGNMQSGFRELSRGRDDAGIGYSEVEAYAWDLETNVRKPIFFRVRHWRDTKKGGYALTDERDIYELVANMASRRVRNCILAVIPGDVTEAAVRQCEVTLSAAADTSPEAQKKLLEAFAAYGVTREMIERRIQRRLDTIQPAQVVNLKKVYASLRDGMSVVTDWFEGEAPVVAETAAKSAAERLRGAANRTARAADQTPPPNVDPQTGELLGGGE